LSDPWPSTTGPRTGGGTSSEYRSSFCEAPPHIMAATTTTGIPVANQDGWSAKGAGPASPSSDVRLAVFAVPRMYATESGNYGCRRPRVM